jgi:transcriptional regulator with XRE-family HTH domain
MRGLAEAADPAGRVSSGVADLDDLLGSLILGDNVVWASDDAEMVIAFEDAFVGEGVRQGVPCHYVTTTDTPPQVEKRLGPHVTILDARPERPFADPLHLEQTLVESARAVPGLVVVEGLDSFARRLGAKRALGLFSRICPQLFDLGAIAYWRAPRQALGVSFLDQVRKVTQCVLEITGRQLRVLKAEGHRTGTQSRLLRIERDPDGTPRLHSERSLGRLAQGLRRLREQRHLTQAELARLAGVSPSAVSQAESGRRGLSLDTLVTLSEQVQLSIDDLLAHDPQADYVLARRDRTGIASPQTALLDDPQAGLRAYLIHLRPGEDGGPPIPHKGVELVVVASGLIQLDLGAAMPVMRAGDAVLATRVAVAGWRNLLGEPARLFWILRD